MARLQAVRGTYDLLPPGSATFERVRDGLLAPARLAGYGYAEAPVFEETQVFERGVGAGTDVVSKEMFSFDTRGGDQVTLRPEGTAGLVRAVVEHGLDRGPLPVKLRYAGPMFRYEKPQAGRHRQFQQVGVEALGVVDPALDAEVIALAVEAFRGLGLADVELLVNTLGTSAERETYVARLRAWLTGHAEVLSADNLRRLATNPLRVLDDKDPAAQELLAGAPLLADDLGGESRDYHQRVRDHLAELSVSWTDAPRLVRGLDYYQRTTFEFVHHGLGAQSAVGGGGRYDGLSESLGGPPLPGIGWALGVERTVLALEAEGLTVAGGPVVRVYGVPLGEQARSAMLALCAGLRRAGISVDMAFGDRGMKGAMKAADRSGAELAVIIGDRDLAAGVAQVKDLRATTPAQDEVALDELITQITRRLT